MRSSRARKWIGSCLTAGLPPLMACRGAAPPPEAPVERSALVAQACPGLELGVGPVDPANARVFVEVAQVSEQDLPRPVGPWLREHIVQVRATAHLVAFPGVPTSTPWGHCVDAVCSSAQLSITLTAQLPELSSGPIELAMSIEERPGEGAASSAATEPRVLLEARVRAVNQEPVVLPPAPGLSGSVVVTPYLLRRHDDLHRVLECQAERTAREAAP